MSPPGPSERLSFHEMNLDDLDDMTALLGHPNVMSYYPRPKTREEALGWILWNQRLYAEHGFGLWLMRLRATGQFVGDCGLTMQTVEGQTDVEVGYHVLPAHQRQGYAAEATRVCLQYAAETLDLARLIAIINPDNTASRRTAEKLGLIEERRATVHDRVTVIYVGDPKALTGI
jgi:RimJ/RimL family protein N-acetyltransferase